MPKNDWNFLRFNWDFDPYQYFSSFYYNLVYHKIDYLWNIFTIHFHITKGEDSMWIDVRRYALIVKFLLYW